MRTYPRPPALFLLVVLTITLLLAAQSVSARPARRDYTSAVDTTTTTTAASGDVALVDMLLDPLGGGDSFLDPNSTSDTSSSMANTTSTDNSTSTSAMTTSTTTTTTTTATSYSRKSRTRAAAAPTSSSSSSPPIKAQKFTGKGTYFTPNLGACGWKNSDGDLIAALNAPQYGNINSVSRACGKMVNLTGPLGTIQVKISDACPECKYGSLDLSPAAFKQIGKVIIGVIPIVWNFIDYTP